MDPKPSPTDGRASDADLGRQIAEAGYLRIRQRPSRRDGDYISLCDIQRVILEAAPDFRGDVYDYGCGGAPYAPLFAGCRSYVKADVIPGPVVDRLLGPDGMTGEPAGSYDWVFSTQVLEHVPEPGAYLRECLRILRPGGQLLLTTHGFYPEHGCPYDYHRWTAEGFVREVRAAGFEVVRAGRLSTGVRGAIQLLHHCVWGLRPPGGGVWGLFLGAVRKVHGWLGVPLLNWFADRFPSQAEASAEGQGVSAIYIGVHLRARKPPLGG